MRIALFWLLASVAFADGLTAEDVYELDRAGVPASLLIAWIRGDGATAIDTRHVLDMQELESSDPVVSELMVLDSARQDPARPPRAILVVANRSGTPLGLRVESCEVRLETRPAEGTSVMADGAEARIPVDAVRHAVILDGRPTGLCVTPAADDVRFEVLPRVEGGHGPRGRVTRGNQGLSEGPLVQPPSDDALTAAANPAEVWSCQVHGNVKRPRCGFCPTCGRLLVQRRDSNAPPQMPPYLGGNDPRDWDPSSPNVFVCLGHPEIWSRSPGPCPLCGVEMQLLR